MKNRGKLLLSIAGSMLIGVSLSISTAMAAETSGEAMAKNLKEGKELAFSRSKGNCLACHMIIGGESPGNFAPPLVGMKSRFLDKEVLRSQIFDASKQNSETSMPLFGRFEILSKDEMDKLVDYIYSL